MNILRSIAVTAVTWSLIASTAAAQSDPAKAWSLGKLEAALPTVQTIVDVVSWVGPKPPAASEFSYSETRRFDMQLHESMKAKLDKINIQVDGKFSSGSIPDRMGRWLKAVEKKGTVRTCVIEDKTKG